MSSAPNQIKVADMKVVEKKGRFEVECYRRRVQKRLHLNQTYASLLNDGHLSKNDREYIQNNLSKAKEFIKAVDNRFSTMENVMMAIVKHQEAFFRQGPAFLKPMILQDIADEVGRDLSTISRVTNGKYVDTPYGIFELKQFFTTGIKQGSAANDEVIGSAQILEAIKKLVDEEDKKKPLSDQAIADALDKQGIKVARRTVAKYREEELKILPARLRKAL
jgi:RNA polymerase sigma-54 factor